jgi:hypothetical protein
VRRGWRSLFLLVCLSSCAGDLRDPERFGFLVPRDAATQDSTLEVDNTPPQCVLDVFKTKCAQTAGCHTENATPLDLQSDGVGDRLVDQGTFANGVCKGKILLSTKKGTDSLLAQKLTDKQPCGAKMPLTGTLTPTEQMCLNDWIATVTGGK